MSALPLHTSRRMRSLIEAFLGNCFLNIFKSQIVCRYCPKAKLKLHKRPYKARFIANSSSCTTTKLSKLLTSRKLLRIKVTQDLHLTYSKNGGNLGLVLKIKNIACISILLTKHVKYSHLYLFKFALYSIVVFKAN